MSAFTESVRRLLGVEVRELPGSLFAGEIPLSNALVNRLIAGRLAAAQLPVAAIRVEAHDGNRMDVTLSMKTAIVPDMKIAVLIEQQPDFPANPVVWLRWYAPAMSAISRFAGPALAFFGKLPPGIRVEGDRIAVDLAELLRWRGLGELFEYITRVQLTAREGAIVVEFALRIPEAVDSRQ
jgi:hypothetical protein